MEAAQRLHGLIQRQWPESEIWRELPLRMRSGGPILQGIADMIVASPNGFHLIEHKTFPGRKDLCMKRAVAAGPQLLAYAEILVRVTGKPCRTLYVHFPFPGIIVKLKQPDGRDSWSEVRGAWGVG